MKIAVEGCAHGELEKIYDTIEALEKENKLKVDLLLCCGDFQATRNLNDLECMAVPPKYRAMGSFYKYYSGEKEAKILTILIGGNHEASNYFQELAYGGWVAPNIFYLGHAGVVNVGNVRIAGLSGIFKAKDYHRGRFERVPYSGDTVRSCYHIRALDVFRLKQVSKPIDIIMSHDWPRGIYNHGNIDHLLKRKPFFRDEVESDTLGSKPAAELLEELTPSHWFAAHLHVKFPAVVNHPDGSTTKFLALDKCLPRRQFLQVVDIPHEGDLTLSYDEEWLAILQLTNHLISVKQGNSYLPGPGSNERWKFTPTSAEKEEILKKMNSNLAIPLNFSQTAPPYNPASDSFGRPPQLEPNPQTTTFCDRLGIDDPIALLPQKTTPADSSFNDSTQEYNSFQVSAEFDDSEVPRSTEKSRLRTPLQLPSPLSFSSPVTSTVDDDEKEAVILTPSAELGAVSEESESVSPGKREEDKLEVVTPGPKRFRRRNEAIYAPTDE